MIEVVPRTIEFVDQDDALADEVGAAGIVLEAHAEMANLIGRLDKGAADVMVADNAEFERDSRFLRISERRRHARIRHRHHDIGVDVAFAGEFAADALARLVDAGALHDAVGPRKIDVLEDAETAVALAERHQAPHPARPDNDDFAGLDVAHEIGADDVERASLRRQDPGFAEAAEHQRPHAERVAHADDLVLRQRRQRIGALDLAQRIDQPVDDRFFEARCDQMDNDLGVARRLEQAAAMHEPAPQLVGIGQVAVVADGEPAELEIGEQRLYVAHRHLAGRRIAHMADRGPPRKTADHLFRAEIVADLAHAAMGAELLAVISDDARRLLPAMLQRVQAECRECCCFGMTVDAEDAALLVQVVCIQNIGDRGIDIHGIGVGHRRSSLRFS